MHIFKKVKIIDKNKEGFWANKLNMFVSNVLNFKEFFYYI